MDQDIEFGDVEQAGPEIRGRPDRNKHLAVVPVFGPHDRDLPVFVDLDAMRDMEEHAQSDTSVELGGVLLGGQYEDESGRPFVLVTDCLRAEHYEATKGSFKFTHDTWQRIGRQRDEFPEDSRMIGWYHTHPDWGVFLSGMDMFICENFFNKPLDLALVIDPCRHDRGFFQWTNEPGEAIRRGSGFYLIASRFRQSELEDFVAWLEDKPMLPTDPRFRGTPASQPASIVQVGDSRPVWLAMLGTLTIQFFLVALIAWKVLSPNEATPPAADTIAAIQQGLEEVADARRREIELDAKVEVLDAVMARREGTPEQVVASLVDSRGQVSRLEHELRAHRAFEQSLQAKLNQVNAELSVSNQRRTELRGQLDSLLERHQQLEITNQEQRERIASLGAEAIGGGGLWGGWPWKWIAAATLIGLICAGGAVAALSRSRQFDENREDPVEESPREANNQV